MNQSIVIGVAAMAAVVASSNILVQFLLGDWLTWGALVYPLAFLVTDVINRTLGPAPARRAVYLGFAAGVLCSAAGSFLEGADGPLVTLRIAVASGAAFLIAQLLDVTLFDRLRDADWWKPPLVSTLAGSVVDTALFFGIAFSAQLAFLEPSNDVSWANESVALLGFGPAAPFWMSLAAADFMVKTCAAFAALAPFRAVTLRMTQPEDR